MKCHNCGIELELQEGFVYVIRCFDLYKIGKTTSPQNRIQNMKTDNPFPKELVVCEHSWTYSSAEKRIQEKFKDKNVSGEWFKLDEEDIETIKLMARGQIY